MDFQNAVLIAFIGAVAGLLGGVLGLGGAIIIIPALVMLLCYSQQMDILKKAFAIMLVGVAIKMWFQKQIQ